MRFPPAAGRLVRRCNVVLAAAALGLITAGVLAGPSIPSGSAGAAGSAPTLGGFGVQPAHFDPANPATRAYFIPSISPGGSYSDSVVLQSTSSSPIPLLVYPVNGLTGTTSGAVYSNQVLVPSGVATWISPAMSSLTLDPGQTVNVPFTVNVPASIGVGDHLGGIAFQEANPTSSGGNFNITQVLRTVIGIQVVVPGPGIFQPDLTSLALDALAGTTDSSVTVGLGNVGQLLGKPTLTIDLNGPGGYRKAVSRQLDTVLPADSIKYPFPWPDGLASGWYTVTATATGGSQTVRLSKHIFLGTQLNSPNSTTTTTPVTPHVTVSNGIPWWSFLIAIVVGALLVLLVVLFRSVRRERRGSPPGGGPGSGGPTGGPPAPTGGGSDQRTDAPVASRSGGSDG